MEIVRPCWKLAAVFVVTALLGHAGRWVFHATPLAEMRENPEPPAVVKSNRHTGAAGSGERAAAVDNFEERMNGLDLSSAVGKATAAVWVARAAASDPVKTFEYLQSHDWENLPRSLKETFFNVWAGMDPDAAVATMTALPAGPFKKDAECHLFHAMCEQQPVRALEMMLANGEKLIKELDYASSLPRYYSTFFNMALKDPELAKRNLERVPAESREQALQGITRSLARTDLSEAVRFAMSASDPVAAKSLLTTALQEGLMNQSDNVWPLLQSSLSGLGNPDKKALLGALTREILNGRPQEGMNLLLSSAANDKERRGTETLIFNTLARDNPTLALQLIAERYPGGPDEVPSSGADHFPKEQYFQALAETDPAELVAYLGKHPAAPISWETEMLVRQAGKDDPAAMLEMLTAADESSSRQEAAANFLMAWVGWDPQAASQWLAEHGTGNAVLEAAWQEKLMQESIHKSPEAAALDFLKEATASPEAVKRVKTIGFLWSVKDPQAAAAWAAQLPAPELGEAAVDAVSHQWLEQDFVAAGEWISGLPPGNARTKAIQNLTTAKQRQETLGRGKADDD